MTKIETRLVHESSPPDPETGSLVPPIYSTSTFRQERLGENKGYEYTRTGNPTRAVLEQAMAKLEGGARGFAFASGSAALDTVCHLLAKGDHVVAAQETYGGTRRLLDHAYSKMGVTSTFVAKMDVDAWARAIRPGTKMVILETPSNPLLRLVDLERVAKVAREVGAWTLVDNTFATPYLQRPLELGADIVLHSATKYLGGHSDLLAGVAVVKDKKVAETVGFFQNAVGAVASPWDAWLVLRGLKTLHLRMETASSNAQAIASELERHPKVERVHFPGLKSHPQHALAKAQMRRPGGMLSFEVKGGEAAAKRVLRSQGSLTLAESLGSVESLLCQPWSMTHASIPEAARREIGIKPNLVRMSVGVENVDDLLSDLKALLR